MKLTFNENQWEQVWSQPIGETKARFVCPLVLTKNVIALLMSSSGIWAEEWRLGAYIQREIRSGLTIGGNQDARLDGSRKLYINRLQIFTYSTECDYSLIAYNKTYNATLFAYQYTGIIT